MLQVETEVSEIAAIQPLRLDQILPPSDDESNKQGESHLDGAPTFDATPHWDILNVSIGGGTRIRIKNPALRAYFFFSSDLEIVSSNLLENPGDSEDLKAVKALRSVFDVLSFVSSITELREVTVEELVQYPGLGLDVIINFAKTIEAAVEAQAGESIEAFKKGIFNFNELSSALNVTGVYIVFNEGGTKMCFKTRSAKIRQTMFGTYIEVAGMLTNHNGKDLIQSQHTLKISQFSGKKTSAEIGVYSLENNPKIKADLIERGKKYVELVSQPSYCQYSGTFLRRSYWANRSFKGVGRIMVDGASMRRVDTNYDLYFGIDRYAGNDTEGKNVITEVTDEILMTTPPYVYGFSFVSKVWGEIQIDKIGDIEFRTDSYDKLVLDPEIKKTIFALVDTDYRENADLINGKGGGCIFLLEGNPGVGKTLTAEAIAERLHRPLYMVTVGELGTDVESLEENLRIILDTAANWNAVLLIDEADIFLEARTDLDIERNAMVGVFLRLLEYYEGILFLTSNRASNIDPAFFSRISMAIHYGDLAAGDRHKIWKTLLANSGIPTNFADILYGHKLNGRQIKNCIRNANALAKSDKRHVQTEDFMTVINTALKFDNWLALKRHEAKRAAMGFFERICDTVKGIFK
jgi:hypothetical protein